MNLVQIKGTLIILLYMENLHQVLGYVKWTATRFLHDEWEANISKKFQPKLKPNEKPIVQVNFTDDKQSSIFVNVDRENGDTDYAFVEINKTDGNCNIKYELTQKNIFCRSLRRQCRHLINVNEKWYQTLRIPFYAKLSWRLLRKTPIKIQFNYELAVNIFDSTAGVKNSEFNWIEKLVEKVACIQNIRPVYYLKSDVTKEKMQFKGFIFDTSKLKNWKYSYRAYWVDEEDETISILQEETESTSDKKGKNIPRGAFRRDGFGIAVVMVTRDDPNFPAGSLGGTHLVVAKCRNSKYLMEISRGQEPLKYSDDDDEESLLSAKLKEVKDTVVTKFKELKQVFTFKEFPGNNMFDYSYAWKNVVKLTTESKDLAQKNILQYGTAHQLHFFIFDTTGNLNLGPYLLLVVWVDEEFPSDVILIKKVIATPTKILSIIYEQVTGLKDRTIDAQTFSSVSSTVEQKYKSITKNSVKTNQALDFRYYIECEGLVVFLIFKKGDPNGVVAKWRVFKKQGVNWKKSKSVDAFLLWKEQACVGYNNWKTRDEKHGRSSIPFERYLRDFTDFHYRLNSRWKVLLLAKIGFFVKENVNQDFRMIFGTHYEYNEKLVDNPWFEQSKSLKYFRALVGKRYKKEIKEGQSSGLDGDQDAVLALAYNQDSSDAISTGYELQSEYYKHPEESIDSGIIELKKIKDFDNQELIARFQHIVQDGKSHRTVFYKISNKITTIANSVIIYKWEEKTSDWGPGLTRIFQTLETGSLMGNRSKELQKLFFSEHKDETRSCDVPEETKNVWPNYHFVLQDCNKRNTEFTAPNWTKLFTQAEITDQAANKWTYIQYDKSKDGDSMKELHFYLFEANEIQNTDNSKDMYLLLVTIIDLNGDMLLVKKAILNRKEYLQYIVKKTYYKMFVKWYHTNSIMHHRFGREVISTGVELELKNTEAEIPDSPLKSRPGLFMHIKKNEKENFYYNKSDLYYDEDYGYVRLHTFAFPTTITVGWLKRKIMNLCNYTPAEVDTTCYQTGIMKANSLAFTFKWQAFTELIGSNVKKTLGKKIEELIALSRSKKAWKVVVVMSGSKSEQGSGAFDREGSDIAHLHTTGTYEEEDGLKLWLKEAFLDYIKWEILDGSISNKLEDYLTEFAVSHYKFEARWVVITKKITNPENFRLVFGYHIKYNEGKIQKKYFCALLQEDYHKKLDNGDCRGIVIGLAFNQRSQDAITMGYQLEKEYLIQSPTAGLAQLASIQLNVKHFLSPTLQNIIQCGLTYRAYNYKINTNVGNQGCALVVYSYNDQSKSWEFSGTKIYKSGDKRFEEIQDILKGPKVNHQIGVIESTLKIDETDQDSIRFISPGWEKLNGEEQKQLRYDFLLCEWVIIDKDETEMGGLKYIAKRIVRGRHTFVIGLCTERKNYFFAHKFEKWILFYRPNISSCNKAFSMAEDYLADHIDWKNKDHKIPMTLALTVTPENGTIEYHAQIEDVYLAIIKSPDSTKEKPFKLLYESNGTQEWGFDSRCIETLLRVRKSYCISSFGWKTYKRLLPMIWIKDVVPGLTEVNIIKSYPVLARPVEFETRMGKLKAILQGKHQHMVEIESFGLYRGVAEKERAGVSQVNREIEEALPPPNETEEELDDQDQELDDILDNTENTEKIPLLKEDKENKKKAKKLENIHSDDNKAAKTLKAKMKALKCEVENFEKDPELICNLEVQYALISISSDFVDVLQFIPMISCYQTVSLFKFMDENTKFSLGNFCSPFFKYKNFALDAAEHENFLNGF